MLSYNEYLKVKTHVSKGIQLILISHLSANPTKWPNTLNNSSAISQRIVGGLIFNLISDIILHVAFIPMADKINIC